MDIVWILLRGELCQGGTPLGVFRDQSDAFDAMFALEPLNERNEHDECTAEIVDVRCINSSIDAPGYQGIEGQLDRLVIELEGGDWIELRPMELK